MFRRHNNTINFYRLLKLIVVLSASLIIGGEGSVLLPKASLAADISTFTKEKIAAAEWSVAPSDFQNSLPARGYSYFDYVFSKKNELGQRVYDVPYPFQKVMERIEKYLGYGQQPTAVSTVMFPLGRSLQRNAALLGEDDPNNIDLFFRFPRVVLGVVKEPWRIESLDLRGRLYLGFNEKTKVIEAISYNDTEGRFEYQIVKDYGPDSRPSVVYAKRQLCLSCHQNQTPIFSLGNWGETNSQPVIYNKLNEVMQKGVNGRYAFGKVSCSEPNAPAYCYDPQKNNQFSYFGAPIIVDQPIVIDSMVRKANEYHAYQKLWMEICGDLECKKKMYKAIVSYLLSDREGIIDKQGQMARFMKDLDLRFQKRFPHGLKIPSSAIPNRDPLKDRRMTQAEVDKSLAEGVKDGLGNIRNSFVSAESEPLTPRAPIEIWTSMALDNNDKNANKLIIGLAEFFSVNDLKRIDRILDVLPSSHHQTLSGACNVGVKQSSSNAEKQMLSLSCGGDGIFSLGPSFFYLNLKDNSITTGKITGLVLKENKDCDEVQSNSNKISGKACPTISSAKVVGQKKDDIIQLELYRENGTKARLFDGRSVGITINTKSNQLTLAVRDDVTVIETALDQMPVVNVVGEMNRPFNRKEIVFALAEYFDVGHRLDIVVENPDTVGLMGTLVRNIETGKSDLTSVYGPFRSPLHALTRSCSMCHSNGEHAPPPFIGDGPTQPELSDLNKCQRIEMCAPRMLYRVQMRKCLKDLEENKIPDGPKKTMIGSLKQKAGMPMDYFFFQHENKVTSVFDWQEKVPSIFLPFLRSLIHEKELSEYLQSKSLSAGKAKEIVHELQTSDCPNVDYSEYESLPACDFRNPPAHSYCPSLLAKPGFYKEL